MTGSFRYLIGAGTQLASDDAVGLRVAEAVVELGLESGFRAVEVPNAMDLLTYLDPETEEILLVDCARMGLAPGEFRFFDLSHVQTRKAGPPGTPSTAGTAGLAPRQATAGISTHEGDILKILELGRETGHPIPPLRFLGIEPAATGPGPTLSPALERRVAEYAKAAADSFRKSV